MKSSPCISVLGSGIVYFSNDTNDAHFGQEENAQLQKYFPSIPLRRIPRYARMGLLACAHALKEFPIEDKSSLGLAVGTSYAGIQMSMDFMDSILEAEPRLSSPTAFSHAVNNMGAGLLSLYLGLQGPCHTVTQFSLSFAGALHTASTLINAGRARYMLVGCMEEYDPRFSKACADTSIAHEEGAVFFLIGKEEAALQTLSTFWGKPQAQPHTAEKIQKYTSLQHALATYQSLQSTIPHSIFCTHTASNSCATIHVGK